MQIQKRTTNTSATRQGAKTSTAKAIALPRVGISAASSRVQKRFAGSNAAILFGYIKQIPLFQSVVALFVISLALYLYMVVSIVVATVDRKSLEEQIRGESTELTYKETEYSKNISTITLASVYAAGYVDSKDQAFAVRNTAQSLTLRNE
jgi:hypothetical protein